MYVQIILTKQISIEVTYKLHSHLILFCMIGYFVFFSKNGVF